MCALCHLVYHTWKHVFDLRCGASRSLRDQRSYPPSPGQHPSGACWNQWLAGLPSCWDGRLAATCMWSVHHLAQICTLFPLEREKKKGKKDVSGVIVLKTVYHWLLTQTLLTQQSRKSGPCVHSTVNLECYYVLNNDFAKRRATYHSRTALSALSEGLSTLMSIHE